MQTVTTIGLDIAKSVFQVHGVDGGGQVVLPPAEVALRPGFLRDASAMPGRHRSCASSARSSRASNRVA